MNNIQKSNTPELRFPGFNGEWNSKSFGKLVTNKSKKIDPSKEENNYKCIELEHLSQNTAQLLGYIDSCDTGSIKNYFNRGDVLFGKLRPYLRKFLLAPFDGVCSSEIWVLKGVGVSNDFLFTMIQTNKFINLANQSSGSKMPRADWSVITNSLLTYPTLPEQQKIASFFTAIDKKIELLKKKHSLLEQYKKGVMQKIFAQKIRFKDSNGNDYADWEERKLGEVADIIGGGTPSTANYNYWNGEIDWFTPTEIKANYVIHSERKISTLGLQKSSAKLLPKGTLLLTTRATIGEVSIAMKECTTNQGFQSLVAKSCDNIWLYYWIKKNKFAFIVKANGSTFPEVSKREIEKLKILAPCLQEQTKIANFLSSIDKKIEKVQLQIDKAEEWKKGLLGRMFC